MVFPVVGLLALSGIFEYCDGARLRSHGTSAALPRESPLFHWANASSIIGIDRVFVADFKHGDALIRGLAAATDLQRGEVILSIPQTALLSVLNPQLRKELLPPELLATDENKQPLLYGLVAAHRRLGQESPFAPYLSSLPSLEDFSKFHPLFARAELLETFDEPLSAMARLRQEQVKGLWSRWQRFKLQLNKTSSLYAAAMDTVEDDFRWAYLNSVSRAFHVQFNVSTTELKESLAMVPVGDICNSGLELTAAWVGSRKSVQEPAWRLVALSPVRRGEELIIPYSPSVEMYSNEDLAAEWGFALPGNPHKVWQVPKDDPRCQRVAAMSSSPPAKEPQPQIWSLFASLEVEHCEEALGPAH